MSMGYMIKMVAIYPKSNKNFIVWHDEKVGQESRKVKKGNAYSRNKMLNDECDIAIELRSGKNKDYKPETVPFDGRLILNVCHRIISRKGHLTFLDEDLDHKLFTALSYVASYIGMSSIEQAKQQDGDFYAFLPIQYNSKAPKLKTKTNTEKGVHFKYLDCLRTTLQ